MRGLFTALLSWQKPPCVLCGQAPIAATHFACAACAALLPPPPLRCPVCAIPQINGEVCGECLTTPPSFQHTYVAFSYEPPFDRMVQALKFAGQLAYAPFFARALCTTFLALPNHEWKAVDALVPVPLSPRRLRERGYNQAERLANALSQMTGLPVKQDLLQRVQDSAPQANLPRAARQTSLRKAFVASPQAAGLRLALVDDVMTTGTTLEQSAKALSAMGAIEVTNWVMTRTPLPD